MRNGHKGRMACGILELMLTAGLVTFCTGATAVPAKRKEETVQ